MTDKQKLLKNMVVMALMDLAPLTESMIDEEVDEERLLPKFKSLTDDEVEEVKASIKAEQAIILDKGILIQEKNHEKWFLAKKGYLEMKYWQRYEKYLLSEEPKGKGFSRNIVNKMDSILDDLTDLLGDPTKEGICYNRKGLIIGDVQSGKTANYTGLICKAADAGYKVIVVLTGVIEKLRSQTQKRLDEGFVGAASDAMINRRETGRCIGVGNIDPSIIPIVLTSTLDDFTSSNAQSGFDLRNITCPVLFVVKKNVSVLKRLNKWLTTFNQNGDKKIQHSLLVIDDEADNASINTKRDPEDTPTAINKQIRELLNSFEKTSYVGYTATPYANIFIDPDNYNAMVKEDLFPEDYIYVLESPSNYIGARNIFGTNAKSKFMQKEIYENTEDPTSIASILPLKHKINSIIRDIPADLKTAISAFLLANTIEDLDGLKNNHRSMLINISRFTDVQNLVAEKVTDYLKDMKYAILNFSKLPVEKALESSYLKKIKETYEDVYSDINYSWEEIQQQLNVSCAGIIVQLFNGDNGQDFSYENFPKGLRVIAVGGISLSRGLTLEGLVISYIYRNSKMYDTLLQMGRWFGYRPGYAHLCRIYMSKDSIEWYREISDATDELRKDVKRYQDTDLTPKDFGLRVRSDSTALRVTANNKMRSAAKWEFAISLSGTFVETPEINSDPQINQQNIDVVNDFTKLLINNNIEKIVEKNRNTTKFGFTNVPKQMILDFLERLTISPLNENFYISALTKFIGEDYKGQELQNWDVAFATGESEFPVKLDGEIEFNYPVRSFSLENSGKIYKMSAKKKRLGTAADGKFNLSDEKIELVRTEVLKQSDGTNSSPTQRDYFRFIRDRNPLLTIYFVELKLPDDTSWIEENTFEEMKTIVNSKQTVIGFGIGMPLLSDHETKYARYMLTKNYMRDMFAGDIDFDEDGDD